MKSQEHEYKLFVTLCTYSMHVQALKIFVYIVSNILVCYLFIMLNKTLYISSIEFVYEKLIETKKLN
jgi:hypothetical protein